MIPRRNHQRRRSLPLAFSGYIPQFPNNFCSTPGERSVDATRELALIKMILILGISTKGEDAKEFVKSVEDIKTYQLISLLEGIASGAIVYKNKKLTVIGFE